jgi:hypothetical protein
MMATKQELANIKKLKAEVAAQKQKVSQATLNVISATPDIDPALGLQLAQQAKKNAAPGSPAYVAALDAVTKAKNTISGVTEQRDTLRDRIAAGADDTTGSGVGGSGGGSDNSLILQQQLRQQQLLAQQEADRIKEQKRQEGQSAYDILLAEFNQYGLGALIEPLKALVVSGASPAEFSLKLRETDAYKKRFSANADRIAKGLTALSPAEYIGLEDQYQNIMRNYGLPTSYYSKDSIGTQPGFNQLLANDVSAVELTDRINTAQSRVLNANPEVMAALKAFYPDITNGDILAYSLDPAKALSDIKNKVTAAEIGGAAIAQGLQTGMTRAQELAGYGVTKEQAQQGFQTVAQIAPRGGQLASIYGEDPYTQATAEAEVFNTAGAAEAAAQRKKLTKLEQAKFAGSAGMAGGALSRDRATSQGTYRSAGAGNF